MGFFSKLSERKKEKREREERVKLLFQAMKDYNPGPQIDYKPQVTKKSANKEPQHSHPEQAQPTKQQQQARWCFSIERIGEIAKEQYKNAISDSYEEQLDWAIYYGFQLYIAICNKRRDPGFATAFLDWYEYFLITDWRAPHDFDEDAIRKFIDARLSTYNDIMCRTSSASDKNQQLQESLVQFLSKDRIDDPFTLKVAILPVDQVFTLNISLTSLFPKTLEATAKEWEYVSNTSFYIQFDKS